MPDLSDIHFWSAVAQIIVIDLVLSGDNAVVIALACRNLTPDRRRAGIAWGVLGAVVLRIVLTAFAALLMGWPWLKLIGGLLLLWIGVKLMVPEQEGEHEIHGSGSVWGAVKTIIVADFVMSLDNVVAVAGASHGSIPLLVFGLIVSIPIIIFASQVIMHLMERVPLVVTIGAGLLGWVAGGMIASDPAIKPLLAGLPTWSGYFAASAGATLVVVIGVVMTRRRARGYRVLEEG
ncbi:TerC family protein [Niveibacterium umoris]|uniref:YjbE family integral membrane protein n=1 Tax=Niveibacterium umoris TaxID=1193620 RepID=A0A840BPE0_9RHOO|nr:TerC family protein [Niveibacterium umoris]MBB4012716.1 YjbE family integral membrane protein [Niveibacterium umoris]